MRRERAIVNRKADNDGDKTEDQLPSRRKENGPSYRSFKPKTI